jgi:hypothetical protein
MKEFLLGILVATALYLIWRKEHLAQLAGARMISAISPAPCSSCGTAASVAAATPPYISPPFISPTTVAPLASAALAPSTNPAILPRPPIRTTAALSQYSDTGFVAHYRSLSTVVN